MKKYLISKGIDENNILIENKSTNTYQNIKNSLELINDENANISIATTNYHLFRSLLLSRSFKKNISGISGRTKLFLAEQVAYQPGQVVSKTLVQNDAVSMTIFSFDKGEEISTHAAAGDAMVTVLDGKGRFTVDGEVYYLEKGETLIMPKDIPHAVFGEEKFKMVLVVSY